MPVAGPSLPRLGDFEVQPKPLPFFLGDDLGGGWPALAGPGGREVNVAAPMSLETSLFEDEVRLHPSSHRAPAGKIDLLGDELRMTIGEDHLSAADMPRGITELDIFNKSLLLKPCVDRDRRGADRFRHFIPVGTW